MTERLLNKIKSFFDPQWALKDFSFYIQKLTKIAPQTVRLLGTEKLQELFKYYFQELILNTENLEENILYLPIFLKKYSKKFNIEDSIVELSDFEFTCYQISQDNTAFSNPSTNDLTAEVYSNPIAQALRLQYDIYNYSQKLNVDTRPEKKQNLLLISKTPDTNKLLFVHGEITHAAIIDELHDGKMIKKDLISNVQNKFPEIPQRDWIVALKDLKSNFIILEK